MLLRLISTIRAKCGERLLTERANEQANKRIRQRVVEQESEDKTWEKRGGPYEGTHRREIVRSLSLFVSCPVITVYCREEESELVRRLSEKLTRVKRPTII